MNELPERLLSRRFSRWFLLVWLPLLVCGIAVRWQFSQSKKPQSVIVAQGNVLTNTEQKEAAKLWRFSPVTKSLKEEALARYVCFSPDGRTLAFPVMISSPFSPAEEAEAKAKEESRQSAAAVGKLSNCKNSLKSGGSWIVAIHNLTHKFESRQTLLRRL